jgi:hypothetical protein
LYLENVGFELAAARMKMEIVWFVDDLPRNLRKFEENHGKYFEVKTFSRIDDVLERIHRRDYPDALLCDVFFYDSVEEAERVEAEVEKLAEQLKQTAQRTGIYDHQHAAGIQLMKKIYEFFGNKSPPFPMYAYTSKGPFLLEQSEWDNISTYGAEVLLKNRVLPQRERLEIKGDIAIAKARRSWLAWGKLRSREFLWDLLPNVVVAVVFFLLGRWF